MRAALTVRTVEAVDQTSRLDEMVRELREYAEWLDTESKRVRRALNALDDAPSPQREGSTSDMVLALFESEPDRTFTAQDVADALGKRGWVTDSRDPVNTLRAALARLAERGDLERVKSGRYKLKVVNEDDNSNDDPWASAPTAADDPWASAPTAPAPATTSGGYGGYDDEPPF